jgi:hypothetical protein
MLRLCQVTVLPSLTCASCFLLATSRYHILYHWLQGSRGRLLIFYSSRRRRSLRLGFFRCPSSMKPLCLLPPVCRVVALSGVHEIHPFRGQNNDDVTRGGNVMQYVCVSWQPTGLETWEGRRANRGRYGYSTKQGSLPRYLVIALSRPLHYVNRVNKRANF